jgi:hypothetical protein
MKSQAQLEASIERFRRGFWDRKTIDRPPVGVAPDRSWLPINYLKEPLLRGEVLPTDVTRDRVRTDYEDYAARRAVKSDDFFLDLSDDPQGVADAAARVNELHRDVLDMHFSLVREKLGGYGHIFGYWAPQVTTVIQEDAMGMCSPSCYRDLFMPYNAAIVEQLGPGVFFHLHSTGYRHYRHLLDIPRLAGLQMTVEANGPQLLDLIPVLREILERTRLILFVDSHFDQLQATTRQLPAEGLYLMVSDKFVSTDGDFKELLAANWSGKRV